jgi:hypothetical protein
LNAGRPLLLQGIEGIARQAQCRVKTMLHDPHHDLTILAFRDYASTQPTDETYPYWNTRQCACARFAKHIGLYGEWQSQGSAHKRWHILNALAMGTGAGCWSFGQLTARLDAYLIHHPEALYP